MVLEEAVVVVFCCDETWNNCADCSESDKQDEANGTGDTVNFNSWDHSLHGRQSMSRGNKVRTSFKGR